MNMTTSAAGYSPWTAAMSPRLMLKAYVMEAKYDFIRMLRAPSFSIPMLCLPATLYLMFGVLIVHNDATKASLFAAFSACSTIAPGLFGFAVVVSYERELGLLTLKRALPMPPAAYFLAKVAMATLFGAIILGSMAVAAVTVAHVPLQPMRVVELFIVNGLGSAAFCSIGLLIGLFARAQSAQAITNVIYLPMLALSGLFFPLPTYLRGLAELLPTYHLFQLNLRSIGQPSAGSAIVHAVSLAVTATVFLLLSIRRIVRSK